MEPLEQVTILLTLMQRLAQVMDHERTVLRGMRLDALPEIQEEKAALTEAYEIELNRLRRSPEIIAVLEPAIRAKMHDAMRTFQEAATANVRALLAAQATIERVTHNIDETLGRHARAAVDASRADAPEAETRGQVIPLAFRP